MAFGKTGSKLREGDTVETEWSQVSYDRWCRAKAGSTESLPGMRIVNLYEVVRSVIEQDLSPSERKVALMRWYDNMSARQIASVTGTSTTNVYKTVSRVNGKIKLVLKHIINCEEYKQEVDE